MILFSLRHQKQIHKLQNHSFNSLATMVAFSERSVTALNLQSNLGVVDVRQYMV